MLGRTFSDHDFTQYDPDAPFPDVIGLGLNSQQSSTLKIAQALQREKLSLREVALRFATPKGDFTGTPEQIADKFQLWLETNASDGFVVQQALPGQFAAFVDHVVPILQARGVFREDYEGLTFRDSLGLPVPSNRFAVAKAGRAAA